MQHRVFKKFPTVVPATGTEEESIHNSPTSPKAKKTDKNSDKKTDKEVSTTAAPITIIGTAHSSATPFPLPSLVIKASKTEPAAASSSSAASPSSAATATPAPAASAASSTLAAASVVASKEPTKITLRALIKRQSSILNPLPTSWSKKLQGVDVVVLGALVGLKESEEILDCEESDTQSHLAQTVQAIIESKNVAEAEELLNLAKVKKIFLEKTHRRNLRKFLKIHRDEQIVALEATYTQQRLALEKAYEEAQKRVQRSSGLIDDTYLLGGKFNLSEKELAYLRGDTSKLTKEEQEALAQKQILREKEGLSDNEEEHPVYQDTNKLVTIPANKLFVLQPSTKHVKPRHAAKK
jgi:hypothetical protein